MKKQDLYFVALFVLIFTPFFISDTVFTFYTNFNREHGLITAFIKFMILATMGESLGLRIREGVYNKPGFGLLPRAIVWGFLGLTIKIAFDVFGTGSLQVLSVFGMENPGAIMQGPFCFQKVIVTLTISTLLNLFYAPVLMTFHKITDTHIVMNGGTLRGLFRPIQFGHILQTMNWDTHWNFVLKKTIPLFWIPAQTFNFLLPAETRILVAAIYGIILGAILAFASLKK